MSKIIVYEGDRRRGSTSNAFNDIVTEELMREYTLSFSIVNTDSVFSIITEDSVFLRGGQYFDLIGIDTNTISSNITQITAEHISYRLNKYAVLAGYAFVGTLREILNDILTIAEDIKTGKHAIDEFSIGNLPETTEVFSFRMKNTSEATARDAIISLQQLGFEIVFNNLSIDIVKRRGSDKGFILDYTENLSDTHRVFQKGNGWSYDFKAVLMNGEASLGDDITINDALIGTSRHERIITVVDCADDPTQNRITTGVFVLDNATQAVETAQIAFDADTKANNSIQQNERYNNVYINHTEGFVSENSTGTQRTIMNGTDCFRVQILSNGKWETVTSTEKWGILTPRLTTQDAKDRFYVTVGQLNNTENGYGLKAVAILGNGKEYTLFELGQPSGEFNINPILRCTNKMPLIIECDTDLPPIMLKNRMGYYGWTGDISLYDGAATMTVHNGIVESVKWK